MLCSLQASQFYTAIYLRGVLLYLIKDISNDEKFEKKYEDLVKRQKHQYESVKFISLSISTLGVFSLHSTDFLSMLKETGFDDKHVNYIIRTLTIIAIRMTYYVFCKRRKDWDNPKLLFT